MRITGRFGMKEIEKDKQFPHLLNDDSVHILNRLAVLKVLSCSELAQCVLRQRMNHEKRTNQKSQANQTNQKHRTNRLNETA